MTNINKDAQSIIDFMPIETPRLTIRPQQKGDGAAINAAKAETWDDLQIWMPWAKRPSTIEEDEQVAQSSYAEFLLRENFNMVGIARDTGRMEIFTGLHRIDWTARRFEIGYWARKSAQGKGLVSESTNALTRFAFAALGAKAVALAYADGNEASARVMRGLGFEKEGTMRLASALNDGRVVDQHWYSRTHIEGLPAMDVRWRME